SETAGSYGPSNWLYLLRSAVTMRIIIALLFCLSNPLMAAPSTESTAQLTDAQRQSADNYDLKTMDVIPLTGIPLRLAAYAMTGTNFIKRTIRSLVAKKTFNDIGVSRGFLVVLVAPD
ncbi:hypothetical protein FOZ62_020469, partial [Perkinsus olseni]